MIAANLIFPDPKLIYRIKVWLVKDVHINPLPLNKKFLVEGGKIFLKYGVPTATPKSLGGRGEHPFPPPPPR